MQVTTITATSRRLVATLVRWPVLVLCMIATIYFLNRSLELSGAVDTTSNVKEENVLYERLTKAEQSYNDAATAASTDIQTSLRYQRAQYEITSALVEQIILIHQDQTRTRQEISALGKSATFAMLGVAIAVIALLIERTTRASERA